MPSLVQPSSLKRVPVGRVMPSPGRRATALAVEVGLPQCNLLPLEGGGPLAVEVGLPQCDLLPLEGGEPLRGGGWLIFSSTIRPVVWFSSPAERLACFFERSEVVCLQSPHRGEGGTRRGPKGVYLLVFLSHRLVCLFFSAVRPVVWFYKYQQSEPLCYASLKT